MDITKTELWRDLIAKASDRTSTFQCPISLESHPFQQAKILPCGHALSPVNYLTMVATQPLACPVCRKEFSEDDVGHNGDVRIFCKKAIQDQLDANRAITIKVISSTKSGSGPWEKVSAQTDWRSVTRIKIDS